jgi:DNA-binding IclR family transcriptional regulator
VEVGLSVVRDLDVRSVARPCLEDVVAEIGETAHLVERRGRDIMFLDSVESPKLVRVGGRTGMSLPAYSTAAGKVLLADVPRDELRRLFPQSKLSAVTDRTATSRRELEAELEQVRERGYATNFGESEPDLAAVAAPIKDHRDATLAAITVSSPLGRMTEDDVPRIAQVLADAASRVGAALP